MNNDYPQDPDVEYFRKEMEEYNMIDVTDCDLRVLVKEAYNLSVPMGMGFLHYTPAELTDDEVNELIDMDPHNQWPVHLDYVKGRAVKFGVKREGDRLVIPRDDWYDHTPDQLQELLKRARQ